MSKAASILSDSIAFKDISTGHNSAGNGGDGYNSGNIVNTQSVNFQPYNKAEGSNVTATAGDQVHQKADWDAGNASASADWLAKAKGGDANSNGDQHNYSGHDTANATAETTANQTNWFSNEMVQSTAAGIGGDGGSGNAAVGGNVEFDPTMETNLHLHVGGFEPV